MKDVPVNVKFVSFGCSVKELEILSVSCIRVDVLLCREGGWRGREGGEGGREEREGERNERRRKREER